MHHSDVTGANKSGCIGRHGGCAGDHELRNPKGKGFHHGSGHSRVAVATDTDDPVKFAGLKQFLRFDNRPVGHNLTGLPPCIGRKFTYSGNIAPSCFCNLCRRYISREWCLSTEAYVQYDYLMTPFEDHIL